MKKRILSMILAIVMVAGMLPAAAFAAETDNLCDHHTEHTADCGYAPAVEGSPCTHVHDDACGYAEPIEEVLCACVAAEDGTLTHAEGCGYVEAVAGVPCGHIHDALCGYVEAAAEVPCGYVCEESHEEEPSEEPDPVCICETKCSEDSVNSECAVCSADLSGCVGEEATADDEDGWFTVSGNTVTIDGTLGGKTEATEEDINALVDAIKGYVDSGITTIIVTGSEPAMYTVYSIPAYAEALYRLTEGYDQSPYCGTIDLILPDATEIVGSAFWDAFALNSITLPSVMKLGNNAFYGCCYLEKITFGLVLTEIQDTNNTTFYRIGEEVGGCDLVLNCGQMQGATDYQPNIGTDTWCNTEFKSITLPHIGGEATCTVQAVCTACGDSYGELADHSTTAADDKAATCISKAYCSVCKSEYGEVGDHTAEPTYATNAEDSTQHDVTYSCCGATVTEVHTLDVTTGKCVCGADMTAIATVTDGTNTYYAADAATLNQAVTAILETGSSTFTVELPADAEAGMITAIRRAICDTEGVADGSIHLTLKGVTSIPGTTSWDGVAFGPGDIYDEAGKIVDQELVTQLASINLPDVTEIGAQAFYVCENLVSVSAPKAQTIGERALSYTALTSVEFPELTTIPTDMFGGAWTLSSAKFPKVTTIEQNGLMIGGKFAPENNPTPFPLELTAEGDITFNGSNHFNIADQNYSGKVDLVLCCDKKDAVTFQEDGTATWQVREDLSYTFKSITFKHSYVDGKCTACGEDCAHTGGTATCTEKAECQNCGASYGEVNANNHNWENGVCTYECGTTHDPHTFENGICTVCGMAEGPVELAITKQPTDGEAKLGERYCVEVLAEGEGLKYQWYFRNEGASHWNKSSVTDNTYDDVMTTARMNRQVYCVITDASGNTVTTDTAKLLAIKTADLAITKQPESVTVNYGERFTVTAEAVGDGVSYEWYYLDPGGEAWLSTNIRSATYSATMSEKIDGRAVYCVARDIWGEQAATDAVFLRCERAEPAITRQPANASAKLDEMFNVEVFAEGDGLKYQWYWRQIGSETWNVSGQRDNTYDDVMTSARHNREVYCVITDAWGESLETEVATITGIPEVTLALTGQPESQTVTLGDMFNVNFEAVGDGLKYQWYFKNSGTDTWYKSGQRDNSYDDVMTKARHDRSIYCVVTDAWGYTVTTETVLITAAPKHELAITAQPNDASAKLSENFCVTVEAQGDELRYQWYWRTKGQESWNVSGQRDNTYDDVMTKARHNREVYCVITDMWGKSVETEIALITGIPTATLAITQQPTDAEAALGETFCAGVEAQGDGLSYQWYFRNAGSSVWHKSGVTDNTYDDVMTKTRAGREIYCVITDAWGNTVTTETVTLIRTET